MTEGLTFETVCGNAGGVFDVVFIHGLTGNPQETWSAQNGQEIVFWPSWFCNDFPGVSVYALGFPASVFGKWAKKEMTLYERAENVLEALAVHGMGARPLSFVTHSLGGLLAKQILRTSNESQ